MKERFSTDFWSLPGKYGIPDFGVREPARNPLLQNLNNYVGCAETPDAAVALSRRAPPLSGDSPYTPIFLVSATPETEREPAGPQQP